MPSRGGRKKGGRWRNNACDPIERSFTTSILPAIRFQKPRAYVIQRVRELRYKITIAWYM